MLDVSWWADAEEPVTEKLAGTNPTVSPISADTAEAQSRWIQLTYQAPESLVKVTVNLSDEPQEALGLGPWESRYTAE